MLPSKTCPVCKKEKVLVKQKTIECDNCSAYRKSLHWYQKPFAWSVGRNWWFRGVIVLWFVYMLIVNINTEALPLLSLANPFALLDFGMHELGHQIFRPFGEFMTIAGGSLFQCLFPLITMAGLLQIRMYFSAALCWSWLGLNLFDVAVYVADARQRALPLSTGLGGLGYHENKEIYDQSHDWYQLLLRTGRLEQDLQIAASMRFWGAILCVVGIVLATVLLISMVAYRNRNEI